jgi:DNA-binding transcriptional LysR family regulator
MSASSRFQGAGIALLPDWLVTEEVKRRALRMVLPAWQTDLVSVNAIHRTEHRGSRRVRALVEHAARRTSRAIRWRAPRADLERLERKRSD